MTWVDPRGSATGAAHTTAHADDAKHRVDETAHISPARFARWGPLVAAGALALLVGGGAAVALTGGDSSEESRARPSSGPPSGGSAPASQAPGSTTPSTTPSTTDPVLGSIDYSGVLVSGGRSEKFQMGIACRGPDCNLTGLSLGPAPTTLVRTGPGTFRITVRGEPLTCTGASSSPVSGVVRLNGRRMTLTARSPRRVATCPDGSLEFSASRTRFDGTYLSGGLPGFTVD